MTRRVVLVGAGGVFGSRFAARAAMMPDIELVLAGRRAEPLAALKAELVAKGATAALSIATVDRDHPTEIVRLAPWAVVDAAGPFQGASFELARAVVDAGGHWIDLADAREFVAGFAPALDALARARGVVAITGASSTPALTHAALDAITGGWRRLDRVTVAISPGAQQPGLSVVRAILSWAGRPVACFANGRWIERPGWSGWRRVMIPGVGVRRVSLADTPDLDLLPPRVTEEGLIFAGVEPPVLHWLLWLATWPVRLRLLPTLRPLARPMRALADPLTRLGRPAGGMVVIAEGLGPDGRPRTARWSLAAEAGSGPSVPIAAALACLRRLIAGELQPGARPCVGVVGLPTILAELEHLAITSRSESWAEDPGGLFPRVLGDAFAALPEAVRRVHGAHGVARFAGRAVARGSAGVAALARWVAGLPGRGRLDVEVTIAPGGGEEAWTRRFGTHRFRSRLKARRELGTFEERLGPLALAFSAEPTPSGFRWIQQSRPLGLRVRARAFERDGSYRFSVVVAHPLVGVIVAYAGRLNVNAP